MEKENLKEDLLNLIDDLTEQISSLKEELLKKVFEEDKNASFKRWRAEKGEGYYYLDDFGDIASKGDEYDIFDNQRYNIGNYFKTQKKTEFCKQQALYLQQYKDFIGEDIPTKEDWKDDSKAKYYACYAHHDNFLDISLSVVYEIQGVIYSNSKEKIEKFIKKIGEDNFKKYILEVE